MLNFVYLGDLQWHKFHVKFCENWSPDSKEERSNVYNGALSLKTIIHPR
jgi:hypothetical protein